MADYFYPYGGGKWVLLVDSNNFVHFNGWVEGEYIGTECEKYEFVSEEEMNQFIIYKGFTQNEF